MSKQVAKARLSTARKSNVPTASDSEVKAGDKVLVYREEPREWLGPYLVLSCDQKQVVVDIDETRKPYSIDKVKMYNEPVPEAPVTTIAFQATVPQSSELGSILDDIIGGNVFFTKRRENIEREIQSEHITDRTVKVLLTDVLKPGDPREDTQEFDDAKQKEIDGLLARGTFCPVRREEIPENANILGGRFACTLKNVGTENKKQKHALLLKVIRTRKSLLLSATLRHFARAPSRSLYRRPRFGTSACFHMM